MGSSARLKACLQKTNNAARQYRRPTKEDNASLSHGRVDDETLYSRALNLMSYGKYSLCEPAEMLEDNKILFNGFLNKHKFDQPEIVDKPIESTA